jgi:Tol biopolymer transport system component
MRLRNHVLIAVMVAGLLATTIDGASASFQGQDAVSFVRYDGADTRIFEMRPNGTEEHKVFGPTKGSFVYASAMAPDGRRVAFSASDGIQFDLFVKRIGGGTKQITDTPGRNEYSPVWSPDGELVVFMETDEVTYSAIVRRDADGTRRREIHRTEADYLLFPSVSPDGQRVLFSAPRGAPLRGDGNYDLMTKTIDGTGRRWLTETPTNEIAGDWSPDGDRVAFLVQTFTTMTPFGREPALRPGLRGPVIEQPVYSIRSEGGGKRLITDKPGINGRVMYTPDGKRVMFSRLTSESMDLFSTPVGGGVLKRLTETTKTYNAFDLFQILPT